MRKKFKNFLLIILLCIALGIAVYFVSKTEGKKFEVNKNQSDITVSVLPDQNYEKSPINGLACADARRRPMAVMLSGDEITRPLSGLAEADLVFNMPVITGSITRMMAIYVCGNPKEIGSVRSARHDFIPLARGLDAIYAHWGGSHFALDKLDARIMDNIDALKNPFDVFYRKSGIVSPHNGFSSLSRLLETSRKLGYRTENKFVGYPHTEEILNAQKLAKKLDIGFSGVFDVKYEYSSVSNSYLRWRGEIKEIDKNTGKQIEAKNVVVMFAPMQQIEGQYNDVQIEGEGKARFYINGDEIFGQWKKNANDQTSKLFFYDENRQEIRFAPGQIWVEVAELGQGVRWE